MKKIGFDLERLEALMRPLRTNDVLNIFIYAELQKNNRINTFTVSSRIADAKKAELPTASTAIRPCPQGYYSEDLADQLCLLTAAKWLTRVGTAVVHEATPFGLENLGMEVALIMNKNPLHTKKLLNFLGVTAQTCEEIAAQNARI